MKLPRDLSGEELIRSLCRNWGYGTLNAILRSVAAHKGVAKSELLEAL